MMKIEKLFKDTDAIDKIKIKLPYLFNVAEIENSRAGKIGMEVGTTRERIIVALLIWKFGEENVVTEIPTTTPEVDVKVFNQPISIKTITGLGGIKVIWTVDAQKAKEFVNNYSPIYDMVIVQIKWDMNEDDLKMGVHPGCLFFISSVVQQKVLDNLGKENYLTLPKIGTNPRGVEICREGLNALLHDKDTKCIKVVWKHTKIDYNPYKRWVDYWKEEI